MRCSEVLNYCFTDDCSQVNEQVALFSDFFGCEVLILICYFLILRYSRCPFHKCWYFSRQLHWVFFGLCYGRYIKECIFDVDWISIKMNSFFKSFTGLSFWSDLFKFARFMAVVSYLGVLSRQDNYVGFWLVVIIFSFDPIVHMIQTRKG